MFGVIKGVDGARVLRSGRRLWTESGEGKLKKGNDGDEWFKLIDNSGGGVRNYKGNGWHEFGSKQQVAEMDTDGVKSVPKLSKTVPRIKIDPVAGDRKFGNVYTRKRKRSDAKNPNFLGGKEGRRGLEDKMFGIHFVRRKRSKKTSIVRAGSHDMGAVFVRKYVSHSVMLAVAVQSSCATTLRFTTFLNSILGYMKRATVKLKELSAFLLSKSITDVFSSHGIHFSRGPTHLNSSGICKIFGARQFSPSFAVDFSALPLCFMYMHSSMLLRLERQLFLHMTFLMGLDTDSKTMIESDDISSESEPSDRQLVAWGDEDPCKRSMLNGNLQYRNGLNSGSIRRKRSSRRSRNVGNLSCLYVNRSNNGALVSNLFGIMNDAIGFSSPVSNHKCRRSVSSCSVGNLKEVKSTWTISGEDIESTCCSGNILVVESDKCFHREEGASIMLESCSNQWFIVVKKNGWTRYSHKAQTVMRPCPHGTNGYYRDMATQSMIWTEDNDWKLEFPNKRDWLIFKELHKECCERNVTATTVKNIPVPEIREVSDYGDSNSVPFMRPDSYIHLKGDEVSRALARRTSNYDMDGEDQEWLNRLNNEISWENDVDGPVSEEKFELMVDAFEKAFYCNPDDYSNEKAVADLSPYLSSREVVEAVYSYWMRKRKQKRSALIRVFQMNVRKGQSNTESVLRKKRSFKRGKAGQSGRFKQNGRGKHRGILQAIAAEQDAVEEQNAMLKVEEAKACAKKSVEVADKKRKIAQLVMQNADLATYKATMALNIAQAARVAESADAAVASFFLSDD